MGHTQLCQGLTTPRVNNFLLTPDLNLCYSSSKLFVPLCSIAVYLSKLALSPALSFPLVLDGPSEISLELFLLQAEEALQSQPAFIEALCVSSWPSLDPLQQRHISLVPGAPGLDAAFQMGPQKVEAEEDNALPCLAATPLGQCIPGWIWSSMLQAYVFGSELS